jgi:hypothetical protein
VLRKVGRSLGGAAVGRTCCGTFQRRRRVFVGVGGRSRQVPRSLLRTGDDTREHVVDSPTFVLRRSSEDARSE